MARPFYVRSTAAGQLEAVPVTFKDGVSFGQPKSFPFQVLAGRLSIRPRAFDVLPDGRFVGLVPGSLGPMTPNAELRIVLNWLDELKQRVPLP